MKCKSSAVGAMVASAFLTVVTPHQAVAGVAFNADLASPGVYFGNGNGASPEEFTVNTDNGVEVALRAKISNVPNQPIQPQIVPTNNLYFIPLGSTFNFDYSVNPDLSGTPSIPLPSSLTITNLGTGQFFSFDPSTVGDNVHAAAFSGTYQNSEKPNFFPVGFNPNVNDTFDIVLNVGTTSVEEFVQIGSGVPEPSTWAMMILGFAGIGFLNYRRRKSTMALTAA